MNFNEIKQDVEIEERIAELDLEISKLQTERCELSEQFLNSKREADKKRFDDWGLKKGSCLICFNRHQPDYHWCLIKTIHVTDIDKEYQYINTITGDYREADFEYFLRAENNRIKFSSLEELAMNFNIYVVDDVQLALLCNYMFELKINNENLRHYEETFSKYAELSIKVN